MTNASNGSKITISLKKRYRDYYQAKADKNGQPLRTELKEQLEEIARSTDQENAKKAIDNLRAQAMKGAKQGGDEGTALYFLTIAELRAIATRAEEAIQSLKGQYEAN